MHRFFLPPASLFNNEVTFPETTSRQIAQVLRLKPNSEVIVLDGNGTEYRVQLLDVSSKQTIGQVLDTQPTGGEPVTQVTLCLCLTQREKFEWMLQKCTEIGASAFVPVISSRSLVQSLQEVQSKYERWQKILCEAAEQSHRGKIPRLELAVKFSQLMATPPVQNTCRLIPWEDEKGTPLRRALMSNQSKNIEILIGPEGGFSAQEVGQAKSGAFVPVTLGARILRMETAAMTATALVLYERGDLDARSDQTAQ